LTEPYRTSPAAKYARQARLERQGWTGQRPCAQGNVAAGPDESTIVQLDEAAEPSFQAGLAVAAGNSGAEPRVRGPAPVITEAAAAGDLFTLTGPDVLKRQGSDFDVGVAFS
jgi:hypothetical protein